MMNYRKEQQVKNEIKKHTSVITTKKCQYYTTMKQLAAQ